jgi:hypothetical protein
MPNERSTFNVNVSFERWRSYMANLLDSPCPTGEAGFKIESYVYDGDLMAT